MNEYRMPITDEAGDEIEVVLVRKTDHQLALSAAVAAERKRCREQEVAPLVAAGLAFISGHREAQCWENNLCAVYNIQKKNP